MLATALLAVFLAPPGTESVFDRVKGSIFTIEVHSGNDGSKSTLGSGYLVSPQGHLVTNYHVVGAYVDDPGRYSIRARNHRGEFAARLLRFDLLNDLAILQVDGVKAPPLKLAGGPGPPGSPIVAFGNPHGLGMSLIEGIFNGFAEKGVVERMLLSMPLNAGMSGGPILNAAQEVIGTNVSVIWLSNSLSFGVPVSRVHPLLALPPLPSTKEALLEETRRQLLALEEATSRRLLEPAPAPGSPALVGSAQMRAPAEVFECWDSREDFKEEGLTKSRYGCNLQFSPGVEKLGEVAVVDVLLEHFASRRGRYGFYAHLKEHASSHHGVETVDPTGGVLSAPECVSDRVKVGDLAWEIDTCLSAYVQHPGLFTMDLAATTLSRPREAIYLALHMKGFRRPSFTAFARALLENIRLVSRP